MNFGIFATPERRLIFDINDFDETLPGPWEWDVKRLAASFVIAGRHNGFKRGEAREVALACGRSYREQMARFSQMRAIDVWYERIDVEDLLDHLPEKIFSQAGPGGYPQGRSRRRGARFSEARGPGRKAAANPR